MKMSGWDRETSPYHRGEQELHTRLGRQVRQERMGRRVLRAYMPRQHRDFFAQLPFFVVGGIDGEGWPWATMLFGMPGFVSTPSDRTLSITARPTPGDRLMHHLKPGAALGFLGIELPTRRRNRVNGVVTQVSPTALAVDVVQSFGNCPQYIQIRELTWVRDPLDSGPSVVEAFTTLGPEATALISTTDTFFVASFNSQDDARDTGGADVNHRGGPPGFITVDGDTLLIPDYSGNFSFNTLGNFLLYPKAGLLFVDHATGDIWQLTGTVEVLWEPSEEVLALPDARRAWRFHLDHGVCLRGASPLR